MKKKSIDKTKFMELFFINFPIATLTGLVKDNKLYSLSGGDQKTLTFLTQSNKISLLTGVKLTASNKKNLNKKSFQKQNQIKSFKISLKSLDTKKNYLIDSKCNLKQSPPSPFVKKIKKELELFFRGELKSLDIPLYKRGTPFQEKVWQMLRKIPYGKTKTYSEIAKLIKKPKAYRAVGACCAKNPYLIVTPCHRVLSQQGLGGFALGLKIKNQLLNLEKKR